MSQWWRQAVVYQIYPKSWADSDGDGIGDLPGITQRLEYLSDLGVDALWICPFYRSPQLDGGYDVSDYREVDPLFGTIDDARALIAKAHSLGLRVLIDIVPNHTSSEHPFFQAARSTPPGSPEWQRYHCVRGQGPGGAEPPNDWLSIFGGSAWEPILGIDGSPTGWWYLHLFDVSQPDLNWENPEVRAEFADILRFWFDLGVDGFRVDVAMALVKAPGYPPSGEGSGRRAAIVGGCDPMPQWDQPGVHEIWRQWRAICDSYQPPRVLVGEVHTSRASELEPYLRPDELHMAFNFPYLRCPWDAQKLRVVIAESLLASRTAGAPSTWVIENHDFNRARTRFGRHDTQGFSGPKPPPAHDDELGLARARAAMLLMLALPGSVFLYQGQELGLPEVIDLPARYRQDPAFARTDGAEGYRDGCRVPMPWTMEGTSLGFGPDGSVPWLPQPEEWASLSVEAQNKDPGSMLELTRTALRIRRAHLALRSGALTWRDGPDDMLLMERRAGPDAVLVAANLGTDPVAVEAAGELLVASGQATYSGDVLMVPRDTTAWIRLSQRPEKG